MNRETYVAPSAIHDVSDHCYVLALSKREQVKLPCRRRSSEVPDLISIDFDQEAHSRTYFIRFVSITGIITVSEKIPLVASLHRTKENREAIFTLVEVSWTRWKVLSLAKLINNFAHEWFTNRRTSIFNTFLIC